MILLLLALSLNINAQIMEMVEKITWHGQASVMLEDNGRHIYIDPYKLDFEDEAFAVLITHSHGDHLSLEDIGRVADLTTPIVCPEDCTTKLKEMGYVLVHEVKPGSIVDIDGTTIRMVPMYNVLKTNYHPRENDWVGYIVEIDGVKVYHAGDTERIPEMKNIDCDIALLPLGQTYTMNSVEEAAEAALDTGAEVAIPIHYGMYEGTKEDAEKFKELLDGKMKVVILEPGN